VELETVTRAGVHCDLSRSAAPLTVVPPRRHFPRGPGHKICHAPSRRRHCCNAATNLCGHFILSQFSKCSYITLGAHDDEIRITILLCTNDTGPPPLRPAVLLTANMTRRPSPWPDSRQKYRIYQKNERFTALFITVEL